MTSDTPSGCTASCGASVDAGLFLCRNHTRALAEILSGSAGAGPGVPALVADLEITITRQNRTTAGTGGARSAEVPLPWNEHAAQVAARLATALNDASLLAASGGVRDEDPLTAVAPYDTANLARWLARNLDALRRVPDAGAAYALVADAVTVARRATDRPPDYVFAGPCHAELSDGLCCSGDVYGRPRAPEAVCGDCGARFDASQRREWMLAEIEEHATHSGLLASLVTSLGQPVGSSTIRKWAAAGRLKVVSVDRQGRKLYRIGEVLALLHPERASA